MTEVAKKRSTVKADMTKLAAVKRKLGPREYRDFAVLVYERKVAGVSPKTVRVEVALKFGFDPGRLVFIKH